MIIMKPITSIYDIDDPYCKNQAGYLCDLGYDDIEMEQPTFFWLGVHLKQTSINLISFLINFFFCFCCSCCC